MLRETTNGNQWQIFTGWMPFLSPQANGLKALKENKHATTGVREKNSELID